MLGTKADAQKRAVERPVCYTRQDARSDAFNSIGQFHKPTRRRTIIAGLTSLKSEQRNARGLPLSMNAEAIHYAVQRPPV